MHLSRMVSLVMSLVRGLEFDIRYDFSVYFVRLWLLVIAYVYRGWDIHVLRSDRHVPYTVMGKSHDGICLIITSRFRLES